VRVFVPKAVGCGGHGDDLRVEPAVFGAPIVSEKGIVVGAEGRVDLLPVLLRQVFPGQGEGFHFLPAHVVVLVFPVAAHDLRKPGPGRLAVAFAVSQGNFEIPQKIVAFGMLLVKALDQGLAFWVAFQQRPEQIVVLLRVMEAVQERFDVVDDAMERPEVGLGARFPGLVCQVAQALQQGEIVEVFLFRELCSIPLAREANSSTRTSALGQDL